MTLPDTIANRAAIRSELQTARQLLAQIAAKLDGIDHDAARRIHGARDDLHAAWRILAAAPR